MKILIIGGTRFVGRHIVEAALANGHEVTLFHRGQSGRELFGGAVERIIGDRNTDLELLEGRKWDAAIDTCAYRPREVESMLGAVGGSIGHLLLISTISVYDNPQPGAKEESPLCPIPEEISDEVTAESYGYLKVLCERTVEANFDGSKTILRPGLIVGPWDHTDRFTYWPAQFDRGEPVLAPEDWGGKFQATDARDLAAFALHTLEQGIEGTFNVTAPNEGDRFQNLLDVCAELAPAPMVLVSPDLQARLEIENWVDWPVFHGHERSGWSEIDSSRAVDVGFVRRPLRETVRDTLEWYRVGRPDGQLKAGLGEDRRNAILENLDSERRVD